MKSTSSQQPLGAATRPPSGQTPFNECGLARGQMSSMAGSKRSASFEYAGRSANLVQVRPLFSCVAFADTQIRLPIPTALLQSMDGHLCRREPRFRRQSGEWWRHDGRVASGVLQPDNMESTTELLMNGARFTCTLVYRRDDH